MPTTRSILQHLGRKRLLRLRQQFELELPPTADVQEFVEALVSTPAVTLERLVGQLNARELAALCEAHDLPSAGDKIQDAATLLGSREPTPIEPEPKPNVHPQAPAPIQPTGHRWRDADPLEPGQIVRVRSRQYLVEDLTAPTRHGDATLVRLSCLEDDALGEPLEVLWECEIDARILGKSSWEAVAERGFDRPDLFSAYLHTLRWNCVTSTDPKLFQAPYRAGIQVKDYQLEPLRKALLMPRVRLFVADDVGLGKTIEAGLILREMIMRQRVRRVIVACPPSVVQQWRDEMEQRFGLTFVIVDRAWFAEIRRERGWGANPWKTHTRFIISHALLRDETYAGPLREQLGTFAQGSMLILDEAHNAAPASGARYAVDSNLTRTVRDLAPRFEHKLFLSATPHNGHSNSFAALLEILDPQRFCRGVPVHPDQLADVMVRRLKADVRELIPGEFAKRIIEPIIIEGLPNDAPELELSRLLQRLRELRSERMANTTLSRQTASMLVLTSLQKRLLSSTEAFYRTLDVHRRAIERRAKKAKQARRATALGDLSLLRDGVGSDDERADLSEGEVDVEEQAQLEAASDHADPDGPSEAERALMSRMLDIAAAHRHGPDARFERLVEWIRANQCPQLGQPGAQWEPRRVLIFTEYTDTKRWLLEQLDAVIDDPNQFAARVESFHGGMGDERRELVKRAFNSDPREHPLRILVATDAAREGVNLQNHCADLFHFDVPWNPGRMEQRNGRIDRKLQRAEQVYCRYFVLPQRAEDKVLDTLVRKTKRINEELGSLSPVIVQRMSKILNRGIAHADIDQLASELADADVGNHGGSTTIDQELEPVRKRRKALEVEIAELRDMLADARRWLNLDHRHLRDALTASLELLGAEALVPVDAEQAIKDPAAARWVLPALDERSDATWVDTLDTLRPPRERKQKLWDWRRDTKIRPVMFQATEHLDDEVVHLHLEHRVVRRLLGRFLSQGFVHDELSRACVCLTRDPKPKVLVLGRLSLYGTGAARLHDEIVVVAAEWIEPDLRKRNKLELLAADSAQAQGVLADLDASLSEPSLRKVPPAVAERLRGMAQVDVAALLPQLERRSGACVKQAQKLLAKRGKAEAAAMVGILEAQRQRIEDRIKELDRREQAQQLAIDFGDDAGEQRQLAADRRYWPKRLAELAAELDTEPDKIRAGYEIKATRVDPVGLVYLWPVSA